MNIVVSTTPTDDTFFIKDKIAQFLPTKGEGGLLDWRDPEIEKIFGNLLCRDTRIGSGQLYQLKMNSRQKRFIVEAKRSGIYVQYEIHHALLLLNQLVQMNVLDYFHDGISIPLKRYHNFKPHFKLNLNRFNGLLRVLLIQQYRGSVICIGRSMLCKQNL